MTTNYPSFAIVFSFIGLWFSSHISKEYQIIVGFVFILSFGILHGANDLLILKNLLTDKKAISFSKLLLHYILVVFLGAVLFYFLPSLILLLFVLISGFHFGEQQLKYISENTSSRTISLFQTLYGLVVLLMLFSLHTNEVLAIVSEITSLNLSSETINYSLFFVVILFLGFFSFEYYKNKKNRFNLILELFYLIVFGILFKVASLIWGFALYFIVWHSIPSLLDQIKFLYGDFSKKNCLKYLKSGIFYWIISLTGLGVFYFIFKEAKLFNSLFFSFLAAITFPHVLVILKMFGKKG